MIHLVPAPGVQIRNPQTKLIVGAEGIQLPKLDTFWFKRLQEGSMVEVTEAPKKVSKVKEEK